MTREIDGWPVELRGVTESLVTTLGPNDRWNVAALGLHPPSENGREADDEGGVADGEGGVADDDSVAADDDGGEASGKGETAVTARTWGNTRTWRNFHRQGGGYVQFTRDPLRFVDATHSIYEIDEPVLDSADAWVEVEAEQVDSGESGGTRWEEWELTPRDAAIERETVPTINRGFSAVVEATVAASRLDVDAYDDEQLRDRLAYFREVGRTCGDSRVQEALDALAEYADE